MAATSSMETRYYDHEFGPIKFTSRRKDGVLRKVYKYLMGSVEIEKEAANVIIHPKGITIHACIHAQRHTCIQ